MQETEPNFIGRTWNNGAHDIFDVFMVNENNPLMVPSKENHAIRFFWIPDGSLPISIDEQWGVYHDLEPEDPVYDEWTEVHDSETMFKIIEVRTDRNQAAGMIAYEPFDACGALKKYVISEANNSEDFQKPDDPDKPTTGLYL